MRACVASWVFLGEGHPSFLAPLTCLGSHLLGGDVGDQVLGRLLDGLLCGRLGLCTCVRVLEWSKSSRVEKRTREGWRPAHDDDRADPTLPLFTWSSVMISSSLALKAVLLWVGSACCVREREG
jgi:hypothetical protein